MQKQKNPELLRKYLNHYIKSFWTEKIIDHYMQSNNYDDPNLDWAQNYIEWWANRNNKTIYYPNNEAAVATAVCGMFGFDSIEQLKRADPDLSNKITTTIKLFKNWRGGKFCMSEIDNDKYPLTLAARLVYNDLLPTLSEAQKQYKVDAYKSKYDIWNAEKLREEILLFLKANRLSEYTQDDIAREFCALSTFVYQRLKELVDAKDKVIMYQSSRYPKSHRNYKNAKAKVYKYAPERLEIINDMANVDMYVQRLLLICVKKNPGLSLRQIVVKMLDALGQLDDKIIRRNLATLTNTGQIERRDVAYRDAHAYYMPDVAPPRPEPPLTIETALLSPPPPPTKEKIAAKKFAIDADDVYF